MPQARFDTYYRHDEMTGLLRDYASRYPGLCRLSSLGQSPEGREFWLMEITGYEAGPPDDKPGFYIDGNVHAGEVTASAACLYTIDSLLSSYATDPSVRRLVDTTAFYIRPRVSPDGAELYLATAHNLRSVPRAYPHAERQPGLHPEDVDGDGWALLMRVADADGEWRISETDPRLMVARRADEPAGGPFYRVYPEGIVYGAVGEDGLARRDELRHPLRLAPAYWGLDLNRNFPANWQPEHVQKGSGPYPLSEPETRASADFILGHPNIAMIVCYHTHGHFVFRPPSSRPARDFAASDIEGVYRVLGERYTGLTGGPVLQSYDEKAGTARIGSLMDWGYQHLGIVGWVPELWAWGRDYDGDGKVGDADLLRWNDEELGGEGFVAWRPFEHPQLGRVEIGGWKTKFTSQNPPGKFLLGEIEPHYRWTLYLAESLPRLVVAGVRAAPLGGGAWRVTALVRNTGLLPTNVTEQALRAQRRVGVEAELVVESGTVEALDGGGGGGAGGGAAARRELGHLGGRISRLASGEATTRSAGGGGGIPGLSQAGPEGGAVEVSWIVRGQGRVRVRARSARAGVASSGAVEVG
jgi:murein tripeptide amidase MpaA